MYVSSFISKNMARQNTLYFQKKEGNKSCNVIIYLSSSSSLAYRMLNAIMNEYMYQ